MTLNLEKFFESVSKNLENEFENMASLISHRGEAGEGREDVLKKILRKHIPKRYGVDSGFVFDAFGNDSKQMDIIIYEANYTPVFEIVGEKRYFPCETVVAVGQVRTNIGSRKKLADCLDNIKSAKKLDRSNNRTNELITGPGISLRGMKFDPEQEFRDQIFGFIFCSSSISSDLIISEMKKFNKTNQRNLWTNLVINYNNFLIEYTVSVEKSPEKFLTQDPNKAELIALIKKSENKNIFALFVSILNNFLNIAHIARPDLFSYCKCKRVRSIYSPLEE